MPESGSLLSYGDSRRSLVLSTLGPKNQSKLGQYFTPVAAAQLMASLPDLDGRKQLRILDPGAGSGILAVALVDRILGHDPTIRIDLTVVELDPLLVPFLLDTFAECRRRAIAVGGTLTVEVVHGDYIAQAEGLGEKFDIVVMNPPYAKISGSSSYRQILNSRGIHAPNLYAAFMALAILNLAPSGQLVAITPRSFTNGSSFRKFRELLLDKMGLNHVHLFSSRSSLFAEGGVLQENIVICATLGICQMSVAFSGSVDHNDQPTLRDIPAREMLGSKDANRFIRIPSEAEDRTAVAMVGELSLTLSDISLTVSTGRVVDFRSLDSLTGSPSLLASPMVYASNLVAGNVEHPKSGGKPQWFEARNPREARMCFPAGNYVVVKRFTSSEERRRVVAAVWRQSAEESHSVAFDNKLNVIHDDGAGLEIGVATGLVRWLNSSLVDRVFRTFSGHTQINALDLRSMAFPSRFTLRTLGESPLAHNYTQLQLDELVRLVVFESAG
jgi:adenine-specific DNA-methyltransferase